MDQPDGEQVPQPDMEEIERRLAARTPEENAERQARLDAWQWVFICPRCGKGSTFDADAQDGYCGMCHAQTGLPVRLDVGGVTGIIGHLARESDEPVGQRLAQLLGEALVEFDKVLIRLYGRSV